MKQNKLNIISALLFMMAMAIGNSAFAQTFSIGASHNDNTHKTTFTITRSGTNLPEQTINYRTVNRSAYAGVHYTAVEGSYTFPEGITSTQVVVTESAQYTNAYAFHYQTGTTRTYRFEVLDVNGFQLAQTDYGITTGAQFSSTYVNSSVTDLVYFNDNGSIQTGTGNKYLDVSYSSSNWIQVTDAGYDQGVHTVSTDGLYNSNSTLRTILNGLNYKMYATVYFTQKEEHDGYQYIQIYTGNAGTYDNVDDPNGGIGTLTNSLYRACFILSYDAGVMTSSHYQFFPHRYDYVDKAAEIAAGISHYEFDYEDSHLYQQKFKNNSYKSNTSGSLVLSPTDSNIHIRFDAGGGGTDHDEWDFKNLKVRLALVDATKPTLFNNSTNGIAVSAGPYVKGNTFYISVPFSEIVHIGGASKKLNTSWGDVEYDAGDNTNVITFKGTINASAGTTLAITGINNCLFSDLAGNYDQFSSSSFNKTFTGVTCTDTYTLAATNTEFAGLQSEYVVSNTAIEPHPTVYFYKGKKETANKVQLTENTNYTLSWANNNAAGTGSVTATGINSYTGSVGATFPIRWSTYTVSFHGNGSVGIPVTGEMSDQAFQYGVAQSLSANAFSREGFTFAGWNTQPDGGGDSYSNIQEVLGLTTEDGTIIDLYAQWTTIPWTGSGDSEEDPYVIMYPSQLDLLASNVNGGNEYNNKFFKLGADITYSYEGLNENESNYTPIGTGSYKFHGTFDGDNKTISGIRVYTTNDSQGVFKSVGINGTVKNVVLANSIFKGKTNVGGIAGWNNGILTNCRIEGSVEILPKDDISLYHGGIVGENLGTVSGCISAAIVDRNDMPNVRYYGGIVGGNASTGTVKDCLYTGSTVDAYNYYGAIAGKNEGILTNNYYTTEGIWGVGVGMANPSGNDSDGARRARVITLDENIVLVGNQTAYSLSGLTAIGTTALSYNDGNTTSLYSGATQSVMLRYTDVPALGYGCTGFTATNNATVNGNTLTMPDNNVSVSAIVSDVWGVTNTPAANGSSSHPYMITSTTGLDLLAKCVNGTDGYTANNFYEKHFKLGNDITYSYEGLGDGTSNYTAIGNNTSHPFDGTFDGDGKTISGIRLFTTNGFQGLFGCVISGTIKNVILANSIIIGKLQVGGIVGHLQQSSVTNCFVNSDVTIKAGANSSSNHGGIVGYLRSSMISGCISAAEVINNGYNSCDAYSGIVGRITYNPGSTVKNCLYIGTTVTATNYLGAIVGGIANDNNTLTLTNNYYTAIDLGGVNGSDCDGARRARTITLGENVGIAGDQTAYDLSGITAFGTTALSYNNGTSTTIYSGATQDVTLSDAAPQGYAVTSYSLNGTPLEGNAFTMPDSDVTVSATIGVPYIDADGNEQVCTDYTLVESSTGNTVTLGAVGTETWCAVSGNVNITVSDDQAIKTYGAVHLILMDGATLTVEGQFSIFTFGSLSIYGQSLGTGSLVASSDGTAIYVGESLSNPVVNDGGLTINGGIITTISSNSHNIYAYDITINGGSVSANGGGINANGALTLGWRNATDRIYASSYNGDNGVAVKSGQYLSDGTAVYSGSLSDTQIDALAGKTLQPAVALTLPKYVDATSGVLVQEGRTAYVLPDANVTIAAEGCTLADVTVGGEAATDNGDGTWSFIMPATDATVSATVTAIDFTTGHAGTEGDPYIIMYRSQLDLLATRVNGGESYDGKFLKLGADIAYDPIDLDDNGENYTAIGTKVNYRYFNGSFDGDGHIVSGIRINKTGQTDADKKQGLFGYVYNAFIKNVVLSDASITGYKQVGGIVGDISSNNTIQNCLVLNSHITAANNTTNKGAIAGYYTSSLTLTDNYYYNCTVNGASTNVGADGNDRDGARGVNKLTLCEHVIATPAAAVTYQGNGYYVAGTSVTLSVEEGYTLNGSYTVKDANNNDVALTGGDTFEMPASDVTVSADITVTTMAGSGTENDPWIIMYRSQMDQLAISEINNGEYYQLGRDLTYSYEGLGETESNYTPILVNAGGHFDGAGHTISGIRIYPYDNLHNDNKGLFSVNYGTVKNVTLTDAIITGDDYVGGIVGSNTKNGLIDSCHVTSTVIIKAYGYASDYHGGISGDNAGGVGKIPSIRNCTSAATITNNGYENCIDYGGIVGENVGGIVSGCTVYEANITATDVAGGIVGYNYCCCGFEDPVVENCFAIDCTINSGSAGAIISNSNHGTLNHNYYYNCTVNDNTTDIGTYEGDIGEMTYNSVTYYDGAVQVFSITLGEHITATATAAHSYSGNNFYKAGTSVTLSPEEGYAISGGYTVNGTPLVGNTFEMPASDVTVSASIVPDYATWWHADADHDGTTEERAYIITTTTGLNLLASEVNDGNSFSGTFFKLGADIEYDPAILVNGENYTAIGGHFNSNDYAFSGTFDGDGYKVSGIRIHREGVAASTARCKGLFGVASNATIKNVILSDAQIYACSHVGGIVANLIGNNTIEHCLVLNSQITATGDSTPYCGVITGNYTNNVTLTGNYYYNCSLTRDNNTYTNDIGTGSYPVTDRDGARSIHALTLGDSISATPAAAVTYNNNSYYTAGTEVTLSYSGTVPEGERALFSVNGTYISGNTFVIADEDVTVAVDVLPRYSYDTTTKALSLYWGEYNAANHWGNEVVKSEVTSITGTNQVSFTGDCNLLFYEYVNCTSIDLHDANTADMTNCSYMFHVLPSLTSLKLSGWNTGNVATMRSMFNRCSALTSLDLSGWDTGNVTTMYEMFDGCSSLTSLDLSGWDTGNVTSMWWMFFNCSSLTSLDLSGWNTANVVDLENMFHNCSNLTTLDLSGWNTAKVTGMEYLFSGCSSLTSLNLSGWNTEKVTAMHEMFMGCTNLTTITGISGWNTAKVTRMKDMFSGCSSLTSLDLSGWNTGKVTTMEQMFNGCTNLTTLYASGWNTAKVTTMANMFNGCTNLTTITGITGWNTSNVESMNSMFASCTGLTTLDLSGWNTAKVTTLAGMFDQCTNLTTLNLSGWNTAAVKEFQIMFNLCSKLQTIYVSSLWNTNAKVNWGDNMFEECTSLVGGNGTVYNGSFTDIEYARIDEPGHPGYLTLAPNTVTLTKSIVGYGANNNVTTGWHLIASPLAGRTWVTNVANLTKNTYDLYRFDQSAEMEWQNYKAHQNDVDNPFHALENGQGYLYANSGDVTLSFVGTPYSGNGQVTLAKDNNASLSGWNLVGNPFAQTAYIDRDFYVMNNDGSDIVVAARADHHVEAMEGIFVQADEDGEKLTFSTTAPSKGRGQTSELEQIVIELSTLNAQLSTPVIDRAIVRFDEGRQLPKLQLFEGNTKLYIPQDGKEYAIAYSNGVEEMPLCFKAKKNGEYTLSVSGTESGEWKVESGKLKVESGKWKVLRLIDNLTGADIDLLATPSYTFTARNDDYASRFKLVFNANENDNQNENEDFAFISDGEIIVNGEGTVQVIDVTGHVLVTGRANRNISTTGFVPGVYVVRLTNATKSKTQKIIIK